MISVHKLPFPHGAFLPFVCLWITSAPLGSLNRRAEAGRGPGAHVTFCPPGDVAAASLAGLSRSYASTERRAGRRGPSQSRPPGKSQGPH